MAKSDPSPVVRLYLASALQRVATGERWSMLAEPGARTPRTPSDHNLPLMYWYAAEPLAEADPERALAFGLSCGKTIPLLREFMLRRIGSLDTPSRRSRCSSTALGAVERRRRATRRSCAAFARRSPASGSVEPPAELAGRLSASWPERRRTTCDPKPTALGVTFGDAAALESLRDARRRRRAPTPSAPRARSRRCWPRRTRSCAATLQALLGEPTLRDAALAGLALYDDPQTPAKLLAALRVAIAGREAGRAGDACSRAPYGVAAAEGRSPQKQIPAKPTCRPTWSGSCTTSRTTTIDELLGEIWGTGPQHAGRQGQADRRAIASCSPTTGRRRPIRSWAGPCSPRPASSATRCTASAARSAPTSPARTAPTSSTCCRTSSTPAP